MDAGTRRNDNALSPRPLTELMTVNGNRSLVGSSHSSDSTLAHRRQPSSTAFSPRNGSPTVDDTVVGRVGSVDQNAAFPTNSIRVGSENARSKSLAGDPRCEYTLKGRRNQDFYRFKISQMNTNHHLRKNDVICAFREFILNFIGKRKPPPSQRAARDRKGALMRRNRELGNLFHNLSASKFFSWLLLFLNRLQMRPKQTKNQVPRLFE